MKKHFNVKNPSKNNKGNVTSGDLAIKMQKKFVKHFTKEIELEIVEVDQIVFFFYLTKSQLKMFLHSIE